MKMAKRIFAYILVICAVLSLAACGTSGASGTASGGAKNVEVSATPKYAYAPTYTTLVKDSETGIAPLIMANDGLYYADVEKVGEAIPEGITPEYKGQYDIKEARLYYMDFAGKVTKLDGYSPLSSEITPDGKRDYYSMALPESALLDNDGHLVVLEQINTLWSEAPAEIKDDDEQYYEYSKRAIENYIRVLDSSTGSEISAYPIELGEDTYINGIYTDAADNIVILFSGSDMGINVYSPAGELMNAFEIDGYIYSSANLADGSIAALVYEFNAGMRVKVIDTVAGELSSKGYTIPDSASQLISGTGDYDFYYSTDAVLYGFKLDTEESEMLFNWVDCDVNISDIGYINIADNGVVYAISATLSRDNLITTELISVSKVPYDAVPQKEHLTLATVAGAYELYNNVVKFNRTSDKYHIDIKD